MYCMCLLFGSPKIPAHMIGIGGWLHLKSCWVHTHVTKNCFVVVWLLVTKFGLPLGPIKQIRIHAVEGPGPPHIYTNL